MNALFVPPISALLLVFIFVALSLLGTYMIFQEEITHLPIMLKGRLPILVTPGLANVVPWNTVTTQVCTSNWPSGRDSFFFELEGDWIEPPPENVRVLDADGPTTGTMIGPSFVKLGEEEAKQALNYAINHWPKLERKGEWIAMNEEEEP